MNSYYDEINNRIEKTSIKSTPSPKETPVFPKMITNSNSSESIQNSRSSKEQDFVEKIIFQLSKALFVQSLTCETDESQAALQKLTQILENEGDKAPVHQNQQKRVLGNILRSIFNSKINC